METMIWAIGSMVALMLIISFLPLGYTLKGKFFVVIASFMLSLGGLAAASTFPLWQTALMLFGLIFFTAYFMNNRMGTLIYQENSVAEEVFDEGVHYYNSENREDNNLVEIDEELALLASSTINLEKDTASERSLSPIMSNIEEIVNDKPEIVDEDITFLLERNTEIEVNEELEETNLENRYLSEIESLLEIEIEKAEAVEDDMLEELHDLPAISFEEKEHDQIVVTDEESLDDTIFDFLLTKKEIAVDREDIHKEIETKSQVSMQK
ncbi:hypothetical protein QNH20_19845 [Neobacillus sp. WH10]|uniref:hypothetical protein n=1 Tax=Neobacillus sp. WH10 TaxID=3047873 RepID=UPI0024C1DA07|nr:hypothetical protein [Neobacillus sp. WH10]WHY76355.1 hypothetical protein QNH20_19845 [Neobacillus sp. WH10]